MNKTPKKLIKIYTYDSKKQYEKKYKRTKGITLIALVITIVLNCCGAAMV